MTTRPKAEHCKRLTLTDIRPRVKPGQETVRLADGTALALRWGVIRGCFGGDQPGRALLLVCPSCERSARVLRRPPAGGWSCWSCQPVSMRSHRRPGARAGQPKPREWCSRRIQREQYQCAQLLGLQCWPHRKLFWSKCNPVGGTAPAWGAPDQRQSSHCLGEQGSTRWVFSGGEPVLVTASFRWKSAGGWIFKQRRCFG